MKLQFIWQQVLRITAFFAAAALIFMMLLTCSDVFGRYVLAHPIQGAFEGTTYLQAIIVFLGAAWTQAAGGHVKVEILFSRLPSGARQWISLITTFLLILLGIVLTWKTGEQAYESFLIGEYESITTQFLPVWLIRFFVSIGSFLLTIEFIVEFLEYIKVVVNGRKH